MSKSATLERPEGDMKAALGAAFEEAGILEPETKSASERSTGAQDETTPPETETKPTLPEPTEAEKAASELDRKAKSFDLITGLTHKVREAFQRWYGSNETAKSLKKRWESMQEELLVLIERHENPPPPEPMPLFDKDKPQTGEVVPLDESWKAIRLEDALPSLTEALIGKLNAAQLFTMGELAAYSAEDGGRKRLTDLPGIGVGNAGKIEDATMAFWARYKQQADESAIGAEKDARDDAAETNEP